MADFSEIRSKAVYANKTLLDIYGYASLEELNSTPRDKRYTAESYKEYQERMTEAALDGNDSYEFKTSLVRKNGEIRQMQVHRRKVVWNGESFRQLIYIDITDRKKTEEALKQSEENFRNSLENSPMGHRIGKIGGSIVYANRAFLDMYGLKDIVEFKSIPSKERHTPESYAEHLERTRKKTLGEFRPPVYETAVRRPDGTIRHLKVWRSSVIWNGEKHNHHIYEDITDKKKEENRFETSIETMLDCFGIYSSVRDESGRIVDFEVKYVNEAACISYRMSREEQIGKRLLEILPAHKDTGLFDKYCRLVETGEPLHLDNLSYKDAYSAGGTLNRYFEIRAVKLEDGFAATWRDVSERMKIEDERLKNAKLESVGILAGGIAHDFNNMLTAIMGNVSLAMEDIESQRSTHEMLGEAEVACQRAKDLTQQLLTFSKGGLPNKKVISVVKLLKETASFNLSGSKAKPEFSISDSLWNIFADGGQISQVISNMVINAVQAMPNGGLIRISATNVVLKEENVQALPAGNYIEIVIKDQGMGIPKSHLDKIFDPYFTTKQKGSGLGLATSYSIIRNHGGNISVESELGVGTAFHIYIPASAELGEKEREEGPARLSRDRQGTVLVMDDEESIRKLLQKMLITLGYSAVLTSDGAEAVAKYAEARQSGKPFDVVILDLTIPGGLGGIETMRQLRQIDPDVKAIVSSGYSDDQVMAKYKTYGFSAVVSKPYSPGEMDKALCSLFGTGKSG